MRERQQTDIVLAGVPARGVKALLDYVYTARLALSLDNVQDVLAAASHLQVGRAVEACADYLGSQLDADNCVDIVAVAETYTLNKLENAVYRFMSENLSAFSAKSVEFHRLTASQLQRLLSGDFPTDVGEDRVLEILLDWLDRSHAHMAHAHKLLKLVDFRDIHPAHLSNVLRRKSASTLPKSFLSRLEALSSKTMSTWGKKTKPSYLVNVRGMEEVVVKVGGFGGLRGVTNRVTYYLPSVDEWRHLTSIPHVESSSFGCVTFKNELFVFGGSFNQSPMMQEEHIHPFGFRYNPRLNKWTTTSPMKRERCRFSATVYGNGIYVFGGCSENDDEDANELDCERYDVEANSWMRMKALSGFWRSQHASTRFLNHGLFVSGGVDRDDVVLDSILVFHPDNDIWEPPSRRRMPTPRADHVSVGWRERLLFVGGWNYQHEEDARTPVSDIDVYDPVADAWTKESQVPTPRYHAGVTIVADVLYVIGGFLADRRPSKLVERYDLESRTWSSSNYPEDIWEHVCVSLHVPRCRRNDAMQVK